MPNEFSPFSPVKVGSNENPSIYFLSWAIKSAAGSTLALTTGAETTWAICWLF